MQSQHSGNLSPVIYLPHGGGPLPLLGEKSHGSLVHFLRTIPEMLGEPSAILVISAHWEERWPTVTAGSQPELIYDYYGFPRESYEIQYPVPGKPELAGQVHNILEKSGINARFDEQRGFDHGTFIPLKLMYPDAGIPCVQLSLCRNLDPGMHINLGKALAELRKINILILGSGMSFHNMNEFSNAGDESRNRNMEFDNWLIESCAGPEMSGHDREARLTRWEEAPSARYCHPREEHLLPLHVCYGVACVDSPIASVVFNDEVLGKRVTGLVWY